MSSVYKHRYKNALKQAATINRFIKKGFEVFFDNAPISNEKFSLKDGELVFGAGNFYTLFFINDPEYDNGIHTKIKDFNQEIKDSFKVYAPSERIY